MANGTCLLDNLRYYYCSTLLDDLGWSSKTQRFVAGTFPQKIEAPDAKLSQKRCLPFWKRCWTNETCVQQLDRSESETLQEIPWQAKLKSFDSRPGHFGGTFSTVCHGMLWLHVSLEGFEAWLSLTFIMLYGSSSNLRQSPCFFCFFGVWWCLILTDRENQRSPW